MSSMTLTECSQIGAYYQRTNLRECGSLKTGVILFINMLSNVTITDLIIIHKTRSFYFPLDFTSKFSMATIYVRRYHFKKICQHWQLGDIASPTRYGKEETTSAGKGVAYFDIVTISRSCLPADSPRRLHKIAETTLLTWHNCWIRHKTHSS